MSTHATFVLDRSGSMNAIRAQIVDAFKEQADILADDDHGEDVTTSVVTFGGGGHRPSRNTAQTHPFASHSDALGEPREPVEILASGVSPSEMKTLIEAYQPRGNTPMRDGIGAGIVESMHHPAEAYLVLVLSDGKENASQRWTVDALQNSVEQLTDTDRWSFVFIGANPRVVRRLQRLGFPEGNVTVFEDVGHAARTMNVGTAQYMADRAVGLTSTRNYVDGSG